MKILQLAKKEIMRACLKELAVEMEKNEEAPVVSDKKRMGYKSRRWIK